MLIHPVHRRYIKLLKSQMENGTPILLIESDFDEFEQLICRTKKRSERHRALYRLTLRAINRSLSEVQSAGVKGEIGQREIYYIERQIAIAERKSISDTVFGTLLWVCRKLKFMVNKKV